MDGTTLKAFSDELQFILKQSESKDVEDSNMKTLGKGVAGAIGGTLGHAVSIGAFMEGPKLKNQRLFDAIAANARKEGIRKIKLVPDGGSYHRGLQTIHTDPHDVATLAHELGHHAHGNPLGYVSALGQFLAPASMVGGGLSGLSDNETVRGLGRWAPMIARSPQLLSEALASGHAMYNLHRQGATGGELLHAAGRLLPAFGTYLGTAAMETGVAHALQGGVSALAGTNKKRKE
jgi:hypothetical protein